MGASYRLTWVSGWENQPKQEVQRGMSTIAQKCELRAKSNAPYLTGALRNSGRTTAVGELEYAVSFGNKNVKYAVYRHFNNQKNPQTKLYLQKAAEKVTAKDAANKFKLFKAK